MADDVSVSMTVRPEAACEDDGPLAPALAAPRDPAAAALLDWYDRHRRALPWRAAPGVSVDPYAVWLSEVMLQQTTVAAVKPYFAAFLTRWPTIEALAAAPRDAVMQQWAGLGYYSRARNLHDCAQALMAEHGGRFPTTSDALRALPGIGAYTAAAVAAIAFDEAVAVVDGNVERVMARLLALEIQPASAKAEIKAAVTALLPADRSGDFAQAMMDLGAMLCTPKRPACTLCPVRLFCRAAARGTQERYPIKPPRRARPQRRGAVFYVRSGETVLVRTRAPKGLLGGMAEFPGTGWDTAIDCEKALREAPLIADYRALKRGVTHVFTHFALELDVFTATVAPGTKAPESCRWVAEDRLDQEALPSVMRKVVALIRESGM